MDTEEIEHYISAPFLFSSPFNSSTFENDLRENFEQLAPDLRLENCCKSGIPETGSATVENLYVEGKSDSVDGYAIIEFKEYDEYHFTDGTRRARIDFCFCFESKVLYFRCGEARE